MPRIAIGPPSVSIGQHVPSAPPPGGGPVFPSPPALAPTPTPAACVFLPRNVLVVLVAVVLIGLVLAAASKRYRWTILSAIAIFGALVYVEYSC